METIKERFDNYIKERFEEYVLFKDACFIKSDFLTDEIYKNLDAYKIVNTLSYAEETLIKFGKTPGIISLNVLSHLKGISFKDENSVIGESKVYLNNAEGTIVACSGKFLDPNKVFFIYDPFFIIKQVLTKNSFREAEKEYLEHYSSRTYFKNIMFYNDSEIVGFVKEQKENNKETYSVWSMMLYDYIYKDIDVLNISETFDNVSSFFEALVAFRKKYPTHHVLRDLDYYSPIDAIYNKNCTTCYINTQKKIN